MEQETNETQITPETLALKTLQALSSLGYVYRVMVPGAIAYTAHIEGLKEPLNIEFYKATEVAVLKGLEQIVTDEQTQKNSETTGRQLSR